MLAVWYFGYIVCCLLSSYFYVYIAAFQHIGVKDKWWLQYELIFELIFLTSILLNFLTDYEDENDGKVVRDIAQISMRYLKGNFFWEFLPVLPLAHLFGSMLKSPHHWYIVKVVRLMTASKVFDAHAVYEKIKKYHSSHLHWIAENDPILAENQELDQNKITTMINIGFMIKIIKLALIIANISYFFGFFWYIYCDLAREIIFDFAESDIIH